MGVGKHFDSVFIEVLVVLAREEASILLLDKEEGGGLRGLGFSNFARFEILVNEFFTCFHFFGVHRVALATLGIKVSCRSMAWSKGCCGGSFLPLGLSKTLAYFEYC